MKSSISAKIPTELYEEVQAAIKTEKYTSNTEHIIEGLCLLLRNPEQENIEVESLLQEKEKEIQNLQNEVNHSKEDYARQIKSLEEKLTISPDPSELAQLRARYEELERHNETLKGELEKASQDKKDLKQIHNNYFLQVQTLINQKAIEAPGNKKQWYKF